MESLFSAFSWLAFCLDVGTVQKIQRWISIACHPELRSRESRKRELVHQPHRRITACVTLLFTVVPAMVQGESHWMKITLPWSMMKRANC